MNVRVIALEDDLAAIGGAVDLFDREVDPFDAERLSDEGHGLSDHLLDGCHSATSFSSSASSSS